MTNERSFRRFTDLKNLFFAVLCFRFSNYIICSSRSAPDSDAVDCMTSFCHCVIVQASSVSSVREKDVFMPARHRKRNDEVKAEMNAVAGKIQVVIYWL